MQYQESPFDFVHRLLEEEGIGYHFRHDEDGPEVLVLFDDNADLTRATTQDHGPVRFDAAQRAWARAEPILRFGIAVELATSRVTVRDHDWTSSRPSIEETCASEREGALTGRHSYEAYEHGFDHHLTIHEDGALLATMREMTVQAALPFGPPPGLAHMVHDLPGALLDRFTSSDAPRQAALRLERLQRDRRACRGVGVVTSFSPGRTFELVGHPTLGADGAYLLTKVVHRSKAAAHDAAAAPSMGAQDGYENMFECRPVTTPWRPTIGRGSPASTVYKPGS